MEAGISLAGVLGLVESSAVLEMVPQMAKMMTLTTKVMYHHFLRTRYLAAAAVVVEG